MDLGMHPHVHTLVAILHQHVLVLLAVSHSTSCVVTMRLVRPCRVSEGCVQKTCSASKLVFMLSASYTGCRAEMACRHQVQLQLLALLYRLDNRRCLKNL